MIRTIITPNTQTISFDIPLNYIGQPIEVIAFAKDEGMKNGDQPIKKTFHLKLCRLIRGVTELIVMQQMNDEGFLDTNILVYTYFNIKINSYNCF